MRASGGRRGGIMAHINMYISHELPSGSDLIAMKPPPALRPAPSPAHLDTYPWHYYDASNTTVAKLEASQLEAKSFPIGSSKLPNWKLKASQLEAKSSRVGRICLCPGSEGFVYVQGATHTATSWRIRSFRGQIRSWSCSSREAQYGPTPL